MSTSAIQQSWSFEGLDVEQFRARLSACEVIVDGPIEPGTKVRVIVEAEVQQVRVDYDSPTRTHILRPLDATVAGHEASILPDSSRLQKGDD